MMKGIDQRSLALLKNGTSQQDISSYLSQTREAISKDFVPYFLGANSRTREFFLQHNTITVNELI